MTRRRLSVALVVAVLLVSGVASAQTTDIAALANAGDATAQNRLGHAYFLGQGMPQDFTSASPVEWFAAFHKRGGK